MAENEVRISVNVDNNAGTGLDQVRAEIAALRAEVARNLDLKVSANTSGIVEAEAEIETLRADASKPIDVNVGNSSGGGILDTLKKYLVAIVTMAPQAAGALAMVGAQLGAAGVGVAAFGLAVEPQIALVESAATEQETYTKAVREFGATSTQAKTALKNYNDTLSQMPASTQVAATAFEHFKDVLKDWSNQLAPKTMPILTTALNTLALLIPKLTPLVSNVAGILGKLMDQLFAKVQAGELDHFITMFTNFSTSSLEKIVGWVEKLVIGLKNILVSASFQNFMAQVKQNGPVMASALQNIASAVVKFVAASQGMGGINFKILQVIAQALNSIPMPVLNVLAPLFLGVAAAVKVLTVATNLWDAAVLLFAEDSIIVRAATAAWTAAQWLLDAALDANPIGLLVVGIAALIAIVVLIATKTRWFQDIWKVSWNLIKSVISAVFDWIKAHWPLILAILTGPVGIAVTLIVRHWNTIKTAMKAAWDWINSNVVQPIINFFRNTIPNAANALANGVRNGWNSLKNGISDVYNWIKNNIINPLINLFTNAIPNAARNMASGIVSVVKGLVSAVKSIGGSVLSTLTGGLLAHGGVVSGFAHGGTIGSAATGGARSNRTLVGENGPELVDLAPGSHVHSNPDTQRILGGNSGVQTVILEFSAPQGSVEAALFDIIRKGIRVKGGNVQTVLGRN